jgi:hypothetical protein
VVQFSTRIGADQVVAGLNAFVPSSVLDGVDLLASNGDTLALNLLLDRIVPTS